MVVQKKILIADDDEIDRKILERWCKNQAYSYATCLNGQEAYEKLKNEHFDLLISDLDMPIMGGLALIKEIKKNKLMIPSIAISANEDNLIQQKAIDFGFDYFISKVLNYKELSSQISYVINHNHLLE